MNPQTQTALRTLIVDDEPLARRGIELRLAAHSDFIVIGQCGNGREAVEAISREQPDVMFLDVQMPGMSGLDLVAHVPHASLPIIVFVTAFDRYALAAFDAQALDYLLKPINDERFGQTLQRVRIACQQRTAQTQRDKLMQLVAAQQGASALDTGALQADRLLALHPSFIEVLPIRENDATVRLPVSQIDWIDAAGDYMCIHAAGKTHVLRETMKSLESLLDPNVFQRVHRSTIVNIHRVRQLRPHTNGEFF